MGLKKKALHGENRVTFLTEGGDDQGNSNQEVHTCVCVVCVEEGVVVCVGVVAVCVVCMEEGVVVCVMCVGVVAVCVEEGVVGCVDRIVVHWPII